MKHCYEYPHPAVTVDIALFRKRGDSLEVLLIKRAKNPFKGKWAFPGGFVDENEPLDVAARRELEEETGLSGIDLTQFGAFGDPGRDPRGHTISIAYSGFVEDERAAAAADDAEEAEWFPVDAPPELAFDHHKILAAALVHLPFVPGSRFQVDPET